ncbi:ribonuclease H-like domain-containing protein [Mycena pura]|uniref:Ribonuclease H-like domain-containing protein n=1 Tax=Mycena pura TaxID=153505 RepID=A0AAD6VQQ3_9AGAR|nr:ribonuclease H-like domain-containing protein [Mycena pura]
MYQLQGVLKVRAAFTDSLLLLIFSQPFKDATLRLSTNRHPRIFEVIPIIDKLNEHLEAAKKPPPKQRTMFDVVRMAAVAGLGILDKYYTKMDESIMYRIAMLLHPSYGLTYFDKMGWPKEWKDVALDLPRTQWIKNYRVEAPTEAQPTVCLPTIFDDLDVTLSTDPFEHFIASPPIPKEHCSQPLLWFGTVSPYASDPSPNNKAFIRMAQDFLSAPATSTDVERAFSHGGGMVTKRRHALSAESIRANALVSAWRRQDLVPEAEAIKVLGNRHSRKNKKRTELGGTIEISSGDEDDEVGEGSDGDE